MTATALAMLFPGQGGYFPGSLATAANRFPVVDEVLQAIEKVCLKEFGTSVRPLLLERTAPGLESLLRTDPDTLQMAIYAASVCSYRLLTERGCTPSILIGHSFGEIAALVCGGAYSISDGAEMVAARSRALNQVTGAGYMAAFAAPAERCQALIAALGTDAATVAVENGPNQTVISGTADVMDRLQSAAQALGISVVRLASAFPFHSRLLDGAVQPLREAIGSLSRRPLRVPVFSAILQRAYAVDEDLPQALSSHLVNPVRFASAITHVRGTLGRNGIIFVEVGASNTLVKLVRQILNDPKVAAFATLTSQDGEDSALDTVLSALAARGLLRPLADAAVIRKLLSVDCTDAEADGFWQAYGEQLTADVAARFETYRRGTQTRSAAMEAAPAASERVPGSATGQSRTATASSALQAPDRDALQAEIVALFAEAMEYPAEVFTEDVSLEAELGIDSVKQMELLGKLEARYSLPPRPDNFRLSDYGTLRRITDFVHQAIQAHGAATAPLAAFVPLAAHSVAAPTAASTSSMPREALRAQIVELFAGAMEYPPEVFTDDVELEAELGIDSVKQMELLGKLEARYHLPARPEDFRLSDYGTLRRITHFVHGAMQLGNARDNIESASGVGMANDESVSFAQPRSSERDAMPSRERLRAEIVALFAQAMEYPPEVFTDDVQLEAELGIDSVKQMELLGRLEARFQLPPRPDDFRLSDYGSVRTIVDFVFNALQSAPAARTSPTYAVG